MGVRLDSGETRCLFQGDVPFIFSSQQGIPGRLIQKRYLPNTLTRIEGVGAGCGVGATIDISGTLELGRPQPILTLMA